MSKLKRVIKYAKGTNLTLRGQNLAELLLIRLTVIFVVCAGILDNSQALQLKVKLKILGFFRHP